MLMIKVAICEDDRVVAGQSETHLLEIKDKYQIEMSIEVYYKSTLLYRDILQRNIAYDVLFLDIEIKFLNGIDLAEHIRKMDKHVEIIYVTSHKSYALDAFSVQPYQFLVKPVDWALYEKYFLQIVDKIGNSKTFFHYSFNKVHYKKMVCDIQYFHSDRRIIHLIDKEGNEEKFSGKLNTVEATIKEGKNQFLRIQQSYLINYDYITEISSGYVTMANGKSFLISQERSKDVSSDYAKIVRSKR